MSSHSVANQYWPMRWVSNSLCRTITFANAKLSQTSKVNCDQRPGEHIFQAHIRLSDSSPPLPHCLCQSNTFLFHPATSPSSVKQSRPILIIISRSLSSKDRNTKCVVALKLQKRDAWLFCAHKVDWSPALLPYRNTQKFLVVLNHDVVMATSRDFRGTVRTCGWFFAKRLIGFELNARRNRRRGGGFMVIIYVLSRES